MSAIEEPPNTTAREALLCGGVYLLGFLIYLGTSVALSITVISRADSGQLVGGIFLMLLMVGAALKGFVSIEKVRAQLPRRKRVWETCGLLGLILSVITYTAYVVWLVTSSGDIPASVGTAAVLSLIHP